MSTEPFVLRDVARAQEWVAVCEKSCGYESDRCASILASLCGFGSWDIMVFAIGSLPPSECDESLSQEQLLMRLERYFRILVGEYEIHPDLAAAIVHLLSPSANCPFSGFRPEDVQHVYEEPEEFDIEELFAAPNSPEHSSMLFPLTSEIDTHAWGEVFRYLGWQATALDEDSLIGTPSYVLIDPKTGGADMPVYFVHCLPSPSFDDGIFEDPTVAVAQYACLGNYVSDWDLMGCQGFLVLSSRPQLLETSGKFYCSIGKAYLGKERRWLDLLISRNCKDVTEFIRLNKKVKPGLLGASGLAERNDELCKQIALLLSGFDSDYGDPYDWSVVAMETENGWAVVTAVEDGEYDEEDLAPFLLAPVDQL
ncbi:hypothetical protein H8F21_14820 [Pseudomonas sp. P66]|uniref:DUF1963 domain-containing protein n=1 Tax=Pseudomonas arcuscaelestis TaxID=2710591 RepID=A0ABS2C1A8_9PSED|nr:hypothetical protein [Pseudomonas arcuscaelestis]MBM5458839.1 hypothetical protein [Pseudomonas arcuscaelestis]